MGSGLADALFSASLPKERLPSPGILCVIMGRPDADSPLLPILSDEAFWRPWGYEGFEDARDVIGLNTDEGKLLDEDERRLVQPLQKLAYAGQINKDEFIQLCSSPAARLLLQAYSDEKMSRQRLIGFIQQWRLGPRDSDSHSRATFGRELVKEMGISGEWTQHQHFHADWTALVHLATGRMHSDLSYFLWASKQDGVDRVLKRMFKVDDLSKVKIVAADFDLAGMKMDERIKTVDDCRRSMPRTVNGALLINCAFNRIEDEGGALQFRTDVRKKSNNFPCALF
jgi:hypothetical protein